MLAFVAAADADAAALAVAASDSTTARSASAIFVAAICCASTAILAHIDAAIAAAFAPAWCRATAAASFGVPRWPRSLCSLSR